MTDKTMTEETIGHGYKRATKPRGTYPYYSSCAFDKEMIDGLRAAAVKRNCSMAAVIRLYVEWGLELEEEGI